MEGWIKLHRALQKWEWYNDSQTLHVFLTILLNANHDDGRWRGNEVKRGQWITGRKKLSQITGISERSIRTILKRLEDSQELTIKPTSKFSLISVTKWDSYQIVEQTNDQPTANERPSTDQRPTTNKNEKNEKNENKKPLSKNKSPLPENFSTSERVKLWADEKGHNITPDDLEDFTLHHRKVGSKFVDWDSALMTWMRNKRKFAKPMDGDNRPAMKRFTP